MSQNVHIKSGRVMNLFSGSGKTSTGYGDFVYKDAPDATFQAVVSGTGAVTATVELEYSNDGVNACATIGGSITLSGTTTASDGFTSSSPWKYVRAHLTAVSGTGATVQVYMGV